MRAVILVALLACQQDTPKHVPPPEPPRPNPLEGDIPCGTLTCHTNQVCVTEHAGHTCWTGSNVGYYGIHDQYCEDVPPSCHGVPTCNCISIRGGTCGGEGRDFGAYCY